MLFARVSKTLVALGWGELKLSKGCCGGFRLFGSEVLIGGVVLPNLTWEDVGLVEISLRKFGKPF